MEQYLFHFWIVVWNTRHNFCLTNYVCDLALAFECAVRFLYAVTAFCLCLYLTQHRLFMCVDYWLLHIFIFIWGSTHAKVSFSKVAMEICWYHSCVRTLVNLEHFCSTSFLRERSGATASVSLIQDYDSPIRHILLIILCFTVGYESIAVVITTEVMALFF